MIGKDERFGYKIQELNQEFASFLLSRQLTTEVGKVTLNTHKLSGSTYAVALTLWVIAVFFSFLSSTFVHADFSQEYIFTNILPLVLASILLVGGLSSSLILLTMTSFIISCFILLPIIPNHRYVLLLATFLLAMPLLRKDGAAIEDYFLSKTLPAIRYLTIILYAFACFVKLNETFLDPSRSCASLFFHHIQTLNNFLPENTVVQLFVIYGSIIIEFILPFLFLSRYKNFAVVLGLGFHFILALDIYKYFTNFSGVMALLLIVSAGSDWLARLSFEFNRFVHVVFKKKWIFSLTFLIIYSFVLYFSYIADLVGDDAKGQTISLFLIFRHLLWFCYGMFLVSVSIRILLKKLVEQKEGVMLGTGKVEVLILMLAVLNGSTPFLGLKTRTGFNMYSNLRIEKDFSNHLIYGKSLDLGGYLTDTAFVGGVEGQMVCRGVLFAHTEYPIFEVLRASELCPKEDFSLEYEGRGITSGSAEVAQLREDKTNWILRKFLAFKPIGLKAQSECTW